MYTQLNDRVLWHDGGITIPPSKLYDYLDLVGSVHVTDITPDVRQYNSLVPEQQRITVKTELNSWKKSWTIPDEFLSIDVLKYCITLLDSEASTAGFTQEQRDLRLHRLVSELRVYKKNKLFNLLRTLIYVINTFNRDGVVWGFGRGSSVSSYVLYLIGVHDVDSVEYDLDFSDFIKT